jgi:hypothetical protein
MGYLYNEIIECKHKKPLKFVWEGLISLLVLDIIATVMLVFKGYELKILFAGLLVFTNHIVSLLSTSLLLLVSEDMLLVLFRSLAICQVGCHCTSFTPEMTICQLQ